MSESAIKLQELLAFEELHAPWFSLNENLPYTLLKRNLKLIRGLCDSPKITIDELEGLNEQEIREAIAAHKPQTKTSLSKTEAPKTASHFFYSVMNKSPYFSEITPYTSHTKKNAVKSQSAMLSIATESNSTTKNIPIHGFHLNEGEAFSSIRYFSEDKKSFAKIIAKDGVFTGIHDNLNHEQTNDMIFEMVFQYLLNSPPEQKEVVLKGSPSMVHRLRAAFLVLQKESGTRYADLNFIIPKGMSIADDELNEEYIKKHLGTPKETPRQLVLWRDFLKIDTNSSTNTGVITPPQIDMEQVFRTLELSQEDKMFLNEYQRYLQSTWADILNDHQEKKIPIIEEHEEFMRRTEKALTVFKKAPSLTKDFETLKTLYIKAMETHHNILEALHQNELNYEEKMKKLLPQLAQDTRETLESYASMINNQLRKEIKSNASISEELKKNLLMHEHNMQEIMLVIKDKSELPHEVYRSFGAQIVHATRCLMDVRNIYKHEIFQDVIKSVRRLSEINTDTFKTDPEKLKSSYHSVKERFKQFKKEFIEKSEADETLVLSSQQKEQLEALIDEIDDSLESINATEERSCLKQLTESMQELCDATTATKEKIETLHQNIDKATPHLKDNHGLMEAFLEVKKSITTYPMQTPFLEEQHQLPGASVP